MNDERKTVPQSRIDTGGESGGGAYPQAKPAGRDTAQGGQSHPGYSGPGVADGDPESGAEANATRDA